MVNFQQQLRGQLIPLHHTRLILPNTCIAEVVDYCAIHVGTGYPDWLLGYTPWRDRELPVIDFEKACALPSAADHTETRIAVLNRVNANSRHAFYGLAIQGIPHLATLNSTNINAISHPDQEMDLVLQQVMLQEQQALIPDLDKLETLLQEIPAYQPHQE